jgi:DNA-binding GntR family transcriptional regulator
MEIRESLIIDIESFVVDAIELYNAEKIVKKSEYVNLESRISALNKNDFESEEKYEYFLKYFNQPKRSAEKVLLEREFIEDYLKDGKFLWMCNYFTGIVNWMK